MKRSVASLTVCLMALMSALAGAAYAQSAPVSDIRESNDPDRAAEVERKAEALSGQTFGGSGKADEERSESPQPAMPSDEFYGPGEGRTSKGAAESEGGSGEPEEVVPSPFSPSSPESSGGSGAEEMGKGSSEGSGEGGAYEGEMRDSGPADMSDPYY